MFNEYNINGILDVMFYQQILLP